MPVVILRLRPNQQPGTKYKESWVSTCKSLVCLVENIGGTDQDYILENVTKWPS